MLEDFLQFQVRQDMPLHVIRSAPDVAHAIRYEQDAVRFKMGMGISKHDGVMRWLS